MNEMKTPTKMFCREFLHIKQVRDVGSNSNVKLNFRKNTYAE